jgi:hypothetical protein
MSTSAISAAVPVSQPIPTQTKGSAAAAPAKPLSAGQNASAATATISAAAAALLESTETSAQTAKEAAGGDRQAQTLLAKQADAVAARGPSRPGSLIDARA